MPSEAETNLCGAQGGASGEAAISELMQPVATGNWGCGVFNGNVEVKVFAH
jgi:hypothetical protein